MRARICAAGLLIAATSAAEEERPYHPDPRVIVNVLSVSGPHRRADVERFARLTWGRIVRCYNAATDRPKGLVELELSVSGAGKVQSSRRTGTTLKDRELAECLTDSLKGVAMPKASGRSTARAEIHVAPGDR